jgi:hypothetical protein
MKDLRLLAIIFMILNALCCGRIACAKNLPSESLWSISADSENGKFTAVLKQLLDTNESILEVFEVDGQKRKLSWKTGTSSKSWMADIFISNDGKHVVVLGLQGEHVVALGLQGEIEGDTLEFYIKEKGRIKVYSGQDRIAFPRFCFFQSCKGRNYFCGLMWDNKEFPWMVWNADSGEQVEVNQTLGATICEKGREISRKQILQSRKNHNNISACLFLSRLKRPEDRVLIEKLLADEHFVTHSRLTYKKSFWQQVLEKLGIRTRVRSELDHFYAESRMRELANMFLAGWDGKINNTEPFWWKAISYYHFYLGTVSVKVTLPTKPKKCENLWVYLIPASVDRSVWDNKRPTQYLFADFDSFETDLPIKRTIRCVFDGLTPGKYWVKTVWDKEKPFAKRDANFYRPEKGDYENLVSPIIEVKAGKRTDAGTIKCTHKVKGK